MNNASKSFAFKVDRFFGVTARGSTIGTEASNGVVNYMTMAYILPVHSAIMAAAGLNQTGILLATCLISGLSTIAMGLFANMPIGLAPGMGMNALMAFTYVIGRNYPPSFVLFCIMLEGFLFLIFSATPIRETVIRAIPYQIKMGISFSIGLFIMCVALQSSGLVVANASTLTSMINFRADSAASLFAVLTVVGLLIIGALMVLKVKGAMLIGMVAIWGIGIVCQLIGLYVPNPDGGTYSLIPTYTHTDYSTLKDVVGLCLHPDFQALFDMGMTLLQVIAATVSIIITFFYTDCFDTAGTTTGCAYKAGLLDEDGNFPDMKKVMLVDAGSTWAGTFFGLSPITAFVESGAGIVGGARTGLASVITGICFILSMPLSSILTTTPTFATSAALLMVGVMMATAGKEIKWGEESILTLLPIVACAISMVLFYSISEGIAVAIITYVVLHVFAGKAKEVNKLMYVLAIIFICKYCFL